MNSELYGNFIWVPFGSNFVQSLQKLTITMLLSNECMKAIQLNKFALNLTLTAVTTLY
jgi:hypothetical protein